MRLILALIACLLCSCAVVKNQVTVFHSLPPKGSGQTFAMRTSPQGPQLQDRLYAQRIARHLTEYGWVEKPQDADFTIAFGYTVSDPLEVSANVPIVAQTGGGATFQAGTFSGTAGTGSFSGTTYSPATFGVVGSHRISQTAYERNLKIAAFDRAGQEVLDARSQSLGTRSDINVVMPIMIDTIFADFPGKSGRTKTYHRPRELK